MQAQMNRSAAVVTRREGFTLIEVALAVTVVALGMMALFALMSGGLDNSAKAIADTQAALLAQNTFSSIRERNVKEAQKGTVQWEAFWTGLTNGSASISVAAPLAWSGQSASWIKSTSKWLIHTPSSLPDIRCLYIKQGTYDLHLNKYINKSFRSGAPAQSIVNGSLRYKLRIESRPNGRKVAMLSVWEGEWGDIAKAEPLVFYSEFTNPGDL
jgi:prepilin-type N-terminal cleavage/methylation domain-containing protein